MKSCDLTMLILFFIGTAQLSQAMEMSEMRRLQGEFLGACQNGELSRARSIVASVTNRAGQNLCGFVVHSLEILDAGQKADGAQARELRRSLFQVASYEHLFPNTTSLD